MLLARRGLGLSAGVYCAARAEGEQLGFKVFRDYLSSKDNQVSNI